MDFAGIEDDMMALQSQAQEISKKHASIKAQIKELNRELSRLGEEGYQIAAKILALRKNQNRLVNQALRTS